MRSCFGEKLCAGCFSMVFSMMLPIDFAQFSGELVLREHRCDTVFYRVKRDLAMFADSLFDETLFRNSPSIRTSMSLSISSNFDGKSVENRSEIGCDSGFRPKSASESMLGTFWPRFSYLGGTFGRSGVPSRVPWGSLGRPWATRASPVRSKGAARGASSEQRRPRRATSEPETAPVDPSWSKKSIRD